MLRDDHIMKNIYYRRNLPHIHPADGIFFITARLAGSLPDAVINTYLKDKEAVMKEVVARDGFEFSDDSEIFEECTFAGIEECALCEIVDCNERELFID